MTGRLSIHKDNSELENFKAINSIVDMVDWNRVHDVMKFLSWEWSSCETGVPEVYELKKHALKYSEYVLEGVLKSQNEFFTECGGIRVEAKMFPEGDIWLHVSFVLAGWDNYL